MKLKQFITWFCGLWAFAIGLRFTIELLVCEDWIIVPAYGVNIWFDFVPLCVFGLVVSIVMTRELLEEIKLRRLKK